MQDVHQATTWKTTSVTDALMEPTATATTLMNVPFALLDSQRTQRMEEAPAQTAASNVRFEFFLLSIRNSLNSFN